MDPLRSFNGMLRNIGLPPIELPKVKTDPGVGATQPGSTPVDTPPSAPQPTPLPPVLTPNPPPLPPLPVPTTDPPVSTQPPEHPTPVPPPTIKVPPPPSIPVVTAAPPALPPPPAATATRATALSKPATSVSLKNGHLSIAHKKGDAHLTVEKKGSRILVKSGSQVVGAFPADKVKSLSVNGGTGDDHIKINVGSKVKVAVDSGKGDDHLDIADAKNVSVFAGRGDNHVKLEHVDGAVVDDKSGNRDVTELAHSKHVHMRHRKKSDVVRGLTK